MADYRKLVPFIIKYEGDKYVNDPKDKGGATKYGITLETWKHVGYDKNGDKKITKEDIKLLTYDDFLKVFKNNFWDKCKADEIKSQSVANEIVDWFYNSGKWGVVYPQRILGIKDDGVVGEKTIEAINKSVPKELFSKIKNAREAFYMNIVKKNPSQKKFLKGWLNRVESLKFND